jgi:hypothetical protein
VDIHILEHPLKQVLNSRSDNVIKKVKLSLCFNCAPCHESVLDEWRYSSTHSLTSALDGGEWPALRPGRFTTTGRANVILWIGSWVGPRAGLNAVVKRKIPSPCRDSNPRLSKPQPSGLLLSYPISFHKILLLCN